MKHGTGSQSPHWDLFAQECEELAALLSAGLSPEQAWKVSGKADDPSLASDGSVGERMLSVAWLASQQVGAPLKLVLSQLASSGRHLAQLRREVDAAVAGPRLAARIMLTLPAVGVLMASALGLNVVSFLLLSPLGWTCVTISAVLLETARRWSRHLVVRVSGQDLSVDLTTLVASAGLRVGVGVRESERAVQAFSRKARLPSPAIDIGKIAEMSSHWGIPLADLMSNRVEAEQRRTRARLQVESAELAEKLLIPLGACVLPCFVLLSVVPTVVQLLSASRLVSLT